MNSERRRGLHNNVVSLSVIELSCSIIIVKPYVLPSLLLDKCVYKKRKEEERRGFCKLKFEAVSVLVLALAPSPQTTLCFTLLSASYYYYYNHFTYLLCLVS